MLNNIYRYGNLQKVLIKTLFVKQIDLLFMLQ